MPGWGRCCRSREILESFISMSRIEFLNSYFVLFKARVDDYVLANVGISGTVSWVDEVDKQDFYWFFDPAEIVVPEAKLLCDYLSNNNLMNGDKVAVSENDLLTQLINAGWNRDKAQECINYLCSVEVKMIDDGQQTDSFFIHF